MFSATIKPTSDPTLGITAATDASNIVLTGNVGGAMSQFSASGADFSASVYEYTAEGAGDATVTFTVTAASANSITLKDITNGTSSALTSGVASSAQTLVENGMTHYQVVVSETGKADITYDYYVSDS